MNTLNPEDVFDVFVNIYETDAVRLTEEAFKVKCLPFLKDMKDQDKEEDYLSALGQHNKGDIPAFVTDETGDKVLFVVPPRLEPFTLNSLYDFEDGAKATTVALAVTRVERNGMSNAQDKALKEAALAGSMVPNGEEYREQWEFIINRYDLAEDIVNAAKVREGKTVTSSQDDDEGFDW